MQHLRSKSEVSADCRATAEGKKHFSQCAMVSVAVSKLVFVQPGAKVNRVYYVIMASIFLSGLGWVGSQKMDPRPCLCDRQSDEQTDGDLATG